LRSQIKLGRIGGIEIGLHYSWFLIAALIAFSLAAHFHSIRLGWSNYLIWGVSLVTAVLFFVALLLHELAHSLVAKSQGLNVRSITLFALGGVSQIETEAPDAKTEFWIAIVGPITSALVGIACLWAAHLSGGTLTNEAPSVVAPILLWLGYINLALAAFNMIPGYPLDGGRVLRSVLWWITGSGRRATRWASQVGQIVAFLFIIVGVYRFFVGANFGGLWLAFIGWFLMDAARSSYVQFGLFEGLQGRKVADLMAHDCPRVPSYLNLRDFVDEYLLPSTSRCYLVVVDRVVVGLARAEDVRSIPRENWSQTSVQGIMQPLKSLRSVPPEMPATKAIELMHRENVSELPVISGGTLVGIFSRGQLLRFLQIVSGPEARLGNRAA
jgi:Zn-dependent protease/CBS domain-containing protein